MTTDHLGYHANVARTSKASLTEQGGSAFTRALASLGHAVIDAPKGTAGDLVVTVDGIEVVVNIEAASVVNPATVERLLAAAAARETMHTHVVVGDLITGPAREALRDEGWSWLDRRGHLVLRAKGVHIDADISTDRRPATGPPPKPISGTAAISWAVALLLSPESPPSMREIARRVSLSHSAIVTASRRLRDASLVRSDGRPLIPELFWALADAWHPTPVGLVEVPPRDHVGVYAALDVNLDDSGPGWAVAGTMGAAAWGAPVAIGTNYPPDFYVPSAAALRQATLRLGEAPRFEDRACTVAMAPTPLVCAERLARDRSTGGGWRFAHGIFAALDLAQDRARGAEILAGWDPQDFTRAW